MDRTPTRVGVKRLGQVVWDGSAWVLGVLVAWTLRFDFQPALSSIGPVLVLALLLAATQVAVGYSLQLYRGRYRVGSIDEVSGLTLTVGLLVLVSTGVLIAAQPAGVPRSLPTIGGALALGLMLAGRVALRLYRMRFSRAPGARTLIYGAGHTGEHLVRLMLSDPSRTFLPVGVLDDDPQKRRLRTYGIRVLGGGADLEVVVARTEAAVLVVAMTRVSAEQLRDLDRRCHVLGVDLRIIPTGNELLTRNVGLGDISNVTVEDLLGRRPIETDEAEISEMIRGKRVLITGAGGSIGSELSRQVSQYGPAFLGVLDRDESAIQSVQMSLKGHGLLGDDNLLLADLRDQARIREIFLDVRPDLVFHAAALKHLSLLQAFPEEAYKTNVEGTQTVLDAAAAAGVATFVNVSTDKAADPTSVLGLSKLATERLTTQANIRSEGRYLSTRFGNVLGSRGSVINLFREQIESGGPLTVTDPDVTRYFMTVGEAVHLVLQAAAIGQGGTTLVLDMGSPVRIDDVARQLISMSGRQIDITYVGLRPAEKLHEILVGLNEEPRPTVHPLITQVNVAPIAIEWVHEVWSTTSDPYEALTMIAAGDISVQAIHDAR